MVPELPQEVTDYVIGHLWDDYVSLAACSLSCRAWLHTSRTHLHRSIRILSSKNLTRLQAVLSCASEIAQYVRELTLGGCTSAFDLFCYPRANEWLADAAPLLALFTRLDALTLTRLRWNTLAATAPFNALARIQCLRMQDTRFHDWADLRSLLANMPALLEIRFHRVCWDSPTRNDGTVILGHFLPCLESLTLDSGPPHDSMLNTLLAAKSELGLRKISLRWCYANDTKAIGDLVNASGSSLERLHLELPTGLVEIAVARDQISLRACTVLEHIHLDSLHAPGYTSWVPVLLAQIPSVRLRTVALSFRARRVSELRTFDWAALNETIADARWAGVRLVFNISCPEGMKGDIDIPSMVTRLLPNVRGKVVLNVSGL